MSLRTYPLIIHPAFLRFVEASRLQLELFPKAAPAEVPGHRPDLQEVGDVARYLGISPAMIRGIILNKENHYRSFEFPKQAGGVRKIDAPRTFLKVIQWWILDTVLSTVEASPHSFGFVKNRSFVDNARFHVGAEYVLNVDVKNFFPSIGLAEVRRMFQALGYRDSVALTLAGITTYNNILPQGAPTSPSLANIYMLRADSALNELAAAHDLRFSRYADDITLSGVKRIPNRLVEDIRHILHSCGLSLNDRKTRFMGKNQRKEVTGVILGSSGVAVSRDVLNAARGWFHRIVYCPQDYAGHLDRVRGTVANISQIGGRGSDPVVELGRRATMAIEKSL